MNLQSLEWQLDRLTGVSVFGPRETEALRHSRDIVAHIRAALDLPNDIHADEILTKIVRLGDAVRLLEIAQNTLDAAANLVTDHSGGHHEAGLMVDEAMEIRNFLRGIKQ